MLPRTDTYIVCQLFQVISGPEVSTGVQDDVGCSLRDEVNWKNKLTILDPLDPDSIDRRIVLVTFNTHLRQPK